ncbi:MAG: FAD-dependent oxidoreductase [Oscillospiraceae bacterium]|jgi:hypothetical protein|nr:FAD-dependent oxidoreductase [Oscillospiraceae bacterium]
MGMVIDAYCEESFDVVVAGTAAALSVRENILPPELSVSLLQETLRSAGCYLPAQLFSTHAAEVTG